MAYADRVHFVAHQMQLNKLMKIKFNTPPHCPLLGIRWEQIGQCSAQSAETNHRELFICERWRHDAICGRR